MGTLSNFSLSENQARVWLGPMSKDSFYIYKWLKTKIKGRLFYDILMLPKIQVPMYINPVFLAHIQSHSFFHILSISLFSLQRPHWVVVMGFLRAQNLKYLLFGHLHKNVLASRQGCCGKDQLWGALAEPNCPVPSLMPSCRMTSCPSSQRIRKPEHHHCWHALWWGSQTPSWAPSHAHTAVVPWPS